jgi:tetratricopeptide (TPR) repeat protein
MEPAKLGRFIKGDLDWIVMKALSKDRDRRYESAPAFSQDIERFLNEEPVMAGPPTVGYKLRKFVKRNRAQVIAGMLVVLVLSAGIIGTTVGLVEARRQQREAEKHEALVRAEATAKEQARAAEAEERAKADTERRKAIEFRDQALEALRATTGTDVEKLLGAKKQLGANEREYLKAIAKRWQKFSEQKGDDEQSQAIRAEGHFRVAFLWEKLGQGDAARVEYETARELRKKLVEQYPAVPDYQQELARTHNSLGLLLAGLGQGDAALVEHETARDLQKKLVEQYPAVPDYQWELAGTHKNLYRVLAGLRRYDAARVEYETARDLFKKLVEQYPDVTAYQQELATRPANLVDLIPDPGQRDAARVEYETARDLQKKLVEQYPAVPEYKIALGGTYCKLGNLVRDSGKPAESLEWFDKAIALLEPVHRAEPRDVTAMQVLRNSHRGRARAYDLLRKFNEAAADWDKAIELSLPAEKGMVRAARANSRVQAGQVAEAVAEVVELMKSSGSDFDQLYDFACVYSIASDKVADKKQEYADRAMELLEKAVKAGYKDAAHMAKDTDLDPIRGREDFKKLLAEMESKK